MAPVFLSEPSNWTTGFSLDTELNALVREQFTRRLISVGPSPLKPAYWGQPLEDLGNVGARIGKEIRTNMASERQRDALVQRLPVVFLLAGWFLAARLRPRLSTR